MSVARHHSEGSTIAVKAKPNARKNGIVGVEGGHLKIQVTAPPEDGKANEAIVKVLSDRFQVKRSQIEQISGFAHREKVFLLRTVPLAIVEVVLEELDKP